MRQLDLVIQTFCGRNRNILVNDMATNALATGPAIDMHVIDNAG